MKIFIAEYIIVYETFDFNLYEELSVYNYFDYNFYESLCKLNNRFVFKRTYYIYNSGNNVFLKKKQYANTWFWRRKLLKRNVFFRLIPWYFLPRKWLKYYNWWGTIPICYKFFQYGYINELVKNFYVDHSQNFLNKLEFPTIDCSLIFDQANYQYPRSLVWYFELGKRSTFFREQPYNIEYIPMKSKWYKEGLMLKLLNPDSIYFTNGPLHIKRWVYYTYMVFNSDRPRPFIVYGYWTSNFFNEVFLLRILSYRWEIFIDNLVFIEAIIGTNENIKLYLYFFFKVYLIYFGLIWLNIFFSLFYYKENLVKLIILDKNYIQNITWLYAIVLKQLTVTKGIIRLKRIKKFKSEGRKITRKSHVESKVLNILKIYIYIPIFVWYLNNIVISRRYINWIEKNFLGESKFYDLNQSYLYLFLILCNMPFHFFYMWKFLFYKIHIFYYLKVKKYFKFININIRYSYYFNRFFNSNIIYRREMEDYTSFAVIERIMNYRSLYRSREFKNLLTFYVYHLYHINLHSKTGKRKDEYYNYFFFRIFESYEPEREFLNIMKSRISAYLLYKADFSYDILIIHRFFELFNFIMSPLHIRANSSSIFNFYYILIYSKYYYYYFYYGFFFFSFVNLNIFFIYINYFFSIYFYFMSLMNNLFIFIFDGKSYSLIIFILKNYFYIFYFFLRKKYFFFEIFINFLLVFFLTIYYIFYFLIDNLKNILLKLLDRLLEFFSDLLVNDFGLKYFFWYYYYIGKFYLIEYNIIYYIIKICFNFLFNLFLFLLFIFVFTSIPNIKDLLFSDYLINIGYLFVNKIFEYNKFIYFNEVLDNWWIPYFNSKKFINFYYGYENFLELRLRKKFGRFLLETVHLAKRKYFYNKHFFFLYFKSYFNYLKLKRLNFLYLIFRRWFPDSFPWEIYLYMSSYFWLVKHPARHFMPDIFFNTMPIIVSFYLRYKYFLFISKIFIPFYWIWKYLYSYLVFKVLYFTKGTIVFGFSLNFFKFWYNIYYNLHYYFFYFCYYYYYYFLFTFSKIMRYYFVTYNFLNYFWIYRSVRFIVVLDIFNFFRFFLDMIYLLCFSIFYNIFYIIYKLIYFISNLLGLTSIYNYFVLSLNYVNKFHLLISEWFEKVITLNYDLDEYGKILQKHFRNRTRTRRGEWIKRDFAVRSFYKIAHRTTRFEFILREFLFYTKKGLIKNFLIYNKLKNNTFNLFFFSFFSLYIHYMFILFFMSLISFKLRNFFKDEKFVSFTPFFEWERFNKKNRHLLGRIEFYWLYNIRWLKKFEFYIDKHFVDDLFTNVFDGSEIKLGYFLYNSFMKHFVYDEKKFFSSFKYNKFLIYKRYFLERYVSLIRNIDYIFYEYIISKKENKQKIFFAYDLFIPLFDEKRFEFDFKKDLVKNFSYLDYYWLHFAIPQLFYNRDWNFIRVMNKNEISKNLFFKIKKSLFKAYYYYEINGIEAPYDLFEFQFFESNVYDTILLENAYSGNYSRRDNYLLQKVALSRWNMELVYDIPNKNFRDSYAHVGYHDWIMKLEAYFDYLRSINEVYINNLFDFGIFGFIKPIHKITTHIDADVVKSSIDLSIDDSAIGVKYSELYQYEDLGRVATEQYLFKFLDRAFYKSVDDPSVNFVSLSDDTTLTQRNITTWTVLVLVLPMVMVVCFFFKYLYISRYVIPQAFVKEVLYFILQHLLSIFNAEIIVSHKLLLIEHERQFYWISKWLWTRTFIVDLYWIDRYSFWTGKYVKFLQAKNEYLWFFSVLFNDMFRFDTLTFLYWNFYIVAWKECKESVIIFIMLDVIFFFISLFFFLIVSNFFLWMVDFLRYFKKQPNLWIEEDFDIDKYRKEIEEKDKNKKVDIFEFMELDAFKDYRGKINIYERGKKLKKIKKK